MNSIQRTLVLELPCCRGFCRACPDGRVLPIFPQIVEVFEQGRRDSGTVQDSYGVSIPAHPFAAVHTRSMTHWLYLGYDEASCRPKVHRSALGPYRQRVNWKAAITAWNVEKDETGKEIVRRLHDGRATGYARCPFV